LLTVADAAGAMNVTTHQAAIQLGRLERAGWVARAQRGVYLIKPLEAATHGPVVPEDAWVLAHRLFEPCYIGGWTAAEHWELTEQLFRRIFVVTAAPRRRQRETRLSTEFHLVRVKQDRLQGTSLIWRGTERVRVSDRERTIADALVHPGWVGGVTHLVEMLITYRDDKAFDAGKLLARVDELGVGAAYKRLGFLAERLWPSDVGIAEHARLRRTSGTIRLDPGVQARGKMLKRWGLWINVAGLPDE